MTSCDNHKTSTSFKSTKMTNKEINKNKNVGFKLVLQKEKAQLANTEMVHGYVLFILIPVYMMHFRVLGP